LLRRSASCRDSLRSSGLRASFVFFLAVAACEPALDQRLATIDAPRTIVVIAEPPEVAPEETALHRAIVASPDGTLAPAIDWGFCTEPKPPTEDNVVNAACLADAFAPLGAGPEITAAMPAQACSTFGPDTPPGDYRPRDPDITGGYHQPLRVTLPADLGGGVAFASHRIACGVGNAPATIVIAFRDRYVRNANPSPPAIAVPPTIARGATIDLTATWADADAEPYVSYDPIGVRLVDRREAMRVTWYVTGGALAVDASGVAEGEPGASSDNAWTAPDTAGTVHLWAVLRDSRGGASVSEIDLVVQ
jgi:hypothetical protein